MHLLYGIFLIALLICDANSQHHVVPYVPIHKNGNPLPTSPIPTKESDRLKECPNGFSFAGNQCAKIITTQPEIECPHEFIFEDNKCVKFVSKVAECPLRFTESSKGCSRKSYAPVESICPPDFELIGNEQCVSRVKLPDWMDCPSGTSRKGDDCIKRRYEEPKQMCPGGFALVGNECQREETYDCTPNRPTNNNSDRYQEQRHYGGRKPSRHSSEVSEFVVGKTCTRIITENPRLACPKDGDLEGKLCVIHIQIPKISNSGGFKEEMVAAKTVCPEGFFRANKDECVETEEISKKWVCPNGSVEMGKKCALYQQPTPICLNNYVRDGKNCIKTIYADPIVKFTVTYECVGKDCDNRSNSHLSHKFV